MITSKNEALYHIQHTEYQYECGQISRTALETKLEYFIKVLSGFDYGEAANQRSRVNRKYGFSL